MAKPKVVLREELAADYFRRVLGGLNMIVTGNAGTRFNRFTARLAAGWYLVVPPLVPEQFPLLPPTGKVIVAVGAPVKDWWKLPKSAPYLFFTLEACEKGRRGLIDRPVPANESPDFINAINTQKLLVKCVASDDPALR